MSRPLQFGLILAVSLYAFDELVITIALPTIVRDLGGGDWYGISLASYILASLISVVWAGNSIDRRGPVRIFLIGYGLFAGGLLLAMQADSMLEFIAARIIQGLGGGISWTVAYAITNIVIPKQDRPRMIALLDSAWLIPSLLAPTIGGYLIDYLDWHWIFTVQLPFLLIAACMLYPQLKPLHKAETTGKTGSVEALWTALRIAGGAGATSTANGIAASLSMGLAAGIGGALSNHSEFSGGSLGDALGIIWLMAGAACLLCFWVVAARFKAY